MSRNPDFYKIAEGQLLLATSGEYSDYAPEGIYRAKQAFDMKEVCLAAAAKRGLPYEKFVPNQYGRQEENGVKGIYIKTSFTGSMVFRTLVEDGYVEELEHREFNTDYDFNFTEK